MNNVLVTAVKYCMEDAGERELMLQRLRTEKPRVRLVSHPTQDYGMVLFVMDGIRTIGKVSRFDIPSVLQMMPEGTHTLGAQVCSVDEEGQYFTIIIDTERCGRDSAAPDTSQNEDLQQWDDWQFTYFGLLDDSPDELQLQLVMKILTAILLNEKEADYASVKDYIRQLATLARWDVSLETQTSLSNIRRIVSSHANRRIRGLAPYLNRMLNDMGSDSRMRDFEDEYFDQLYQSPAAESLRNMWTSCHAQGIMTAEEAYQLKSEHLAMIDEKLQQLPFNLYYKSFSFGTLMHNLLYKSIPRKTLTMLLSALVMREWFTNELQIVIADAELNSDEEYEADEELVALLSPLFFNNDYNAAHFLSEIEFMQPVEIIGLVNRWVKKGTINRRYCHRKLWTILHEHGLYRPSESNWNKMLTC